MRTQRALELGTTTTVVAAVFAAACVAGAKTAHLSDPVARRLLIASAALPLLAALIGLLRRLPALTGAIALDREANLKGRVASALSFAEQPSHTPLQRAAIVDGLDHLAAVSPRRAVPLRLPRDMWAAVMFVGIVALVAQLEVRRHVTIVAAPTIDALELDPDDLASLTEYVRQLESRPSADDDMKIVVSEFNGIVEDLKAKRIDRNEAFRRIAKLDERLQQGQELDKRALEDALKKVGAELKKNELTRDVGRALEKGDKQEAQAKLRELSAKLKDKQLRLSEEQKKNLADALRKAANRDREKALAEMKQARDKLAQELEKMRQEREKNGGQESAERERDRKNKERELDRLDREEAAQNSADRQLERLDRDLDAAAADILKDLGLSAADLESGAEEINKMARDEMTAAEKEELRQRLKELHDLLVQQGKLSPEQMQKLKEFMKKARGGKTAKAGKKRGGKMGKLAPPGEGQPESDKERGDGDEGDGEGQGEEKSQSWTLGPDGRPVPLPGSGAGNPGEGEGQGQGQQPGQGENGTGQQPGPSWGTGHDPTLLGKKTGMKSGTTDIQVAGVQSDKGPSRSETILGAADKGFVGRGYKKVYAEYKSVAEESLKQDEIPAGYRFYVRRYFDLIRPRE